MCFYPAASFNQDGMVIVLIFNTNLIQNFQKFLFTTSRFTNEKAYIVVCSQELCPVTVDIPTDIIGVIECSVVKEVFSRSATYSLEKGVLHVLIKPQENLLFEVLLQ